MDKQECKTRLEDVPLDWYVAFGPDLKIVAVGRSRQSAKENAIAAGVSAPLVVPRRGLKDREGE